MPDVPGTVNFPASLDTVVSLIEAANNAATTLTAAVSNSDTTLAVASTTEFPDSGALSIEGEVIFYTGTTSNSFTGCTRGQDGTSAAAHGNGATVQGLIVAAHHNTLASAIVQTQTKLGTGASTPSSGAVLRGTGTGASAWGTLPDATTSDSGLMSAADKAKLDNATASATAGTLMQRDGNGRAKVADPSAADDIATKSYVDSSGGGGVTAVTGSGGVTSSGGTTPDLSLSDGGVTDAKLGDRTIDQSTAMGATPNTGALTTLLSRLGNIIKAITGKANWSDTPAITLESLNAHKNRHVSGGADAFASSDVLEAVVKRLQTTTGPTNLAMGAVADGEFLKRSGSSVVGAAAGGAGDYILIVDKKTQNTAGGTFTSGAWRTRDLNTKVVDSGSNATLSSNQVTLAAGTYRFEAVAPVNSTDRHQMRLYNVTDSSVIQLGMVMDANASTYLYTAGYVAGQFTIGSSKTIRVEHRCELTRSTNGFGLPANWGDEIYAILQLWKVA
jgi:hypothetical protein